MRNKEVIEVKFKAASAAIFWEDLTMQLPLLLAFLQRRLLLLPASSSTNPQADMLMMTTTINASMTMTLAHGARASCSKFRIRTFIYIFAKK